MIYRGPGSGGMFGGMYGPQGGWGGQEVAWQPQGGGYRYDAGPPRMGGMFAPPQMSDEFSAGQDVMPTMQPQTDGAAGGGYGPPSPSNPGGTFNGRPTSGNGSWGFGQYPTGWNPTTGRFDQVNGYQPPSFSTPYGTLNGRPLGSGPSQMSPPQYPTGWNPTTGRFDTPQGFGPQGFTGNEWKGGAQAQGAIDPGRNMISQAPNAISGFMVNQRAAAPQQPPQQSFDQFQQTIGQGSGMTYGQMQDAYQKSIAPQSAPNGIFNGNIGPGGTANPYPNNPNPFPSNWGQQTFGFDPRAMAGKQVTGDMGWYYGRDAIGRTINNQGDAAPSFSGPASGPGRSRPWFGR